jgi:hypothetical protein
MQVNAPLSVGYSLPETFQRGAQAMHPILHAILLEPVGWLAIGGSLIMVATGIAVGLFIRGKVREQERERRD